jgi:hypothetical protein
VQVSVKIVSPADVGVSLKDPDTASLPLHPPLAVHAVALVEDQVSVAEEPSVTELGFAARVTVGAGGAVAVSVADAWALPPAPVQVRVNTWEPAAVGVSLAVPDAASVPLHAPLAVHAVALVEDHVSVAASPTVTEVGLTARVTVGAGVTAAVTVTVAVAVALPPGPVHVMVYVNVPGVLANSLAEPETAYPPPHAPLSVQFVALVEDHVRFVA